MHGPEARSLSCPSCGVTYVLDPFVEGRHYRCLRCDVGLEGPEPGSLDSARFRPEVVWLYSRPRGAQPDKNRPKPDRRIGRYVLLDELGRGAMGVVYRAWDADLSRQVALKVLLAGDHSAHEQVERFLREARAAARLHHPGIVRVHDIGWHDDRVFFTMDLVDGPTLREVLDEVGSLPIREAVRIAAAAARALYEAHRRGVVHRDVKPGNVLLRTDGGALIADFGLASEVEADAARLTRSGQVLGTPAYMAPEQATSGSDHPHPLSDQYSLGAVLFEALVGEAPYPGEGAMEVLVALLSGPPDPPLARRGRPLPRDLVVVCEKAMARAPERRYHSLRHLAEDLERILRGEPIHARPPGLLLRLRAAAQRHRVPLSLAATALAASVLSYQGWSLYTHYQERRAQRVREALAAEHLLTTEARIAELRDGGDDEAATELWTTFVTEPTHHGTRALARGQLREGVRRRSAGDVDRAVDALAAAYTAARAPQLQDEALRELASLFRDQWAWDPLSVVLDTLQSRRGGTTEPAAQRWRRDARLALRDLHGAVEALDGLEAPERDLLRALAPAEAAPHLEGRTARLPLHGRDALLVVPDDGRTGRIVALEPGLPTVHNVRFPDDMPAPTYLLPIDTEPPRLVVRGADPDDEAAVLRIGDDAPLVVEHRWAEAALGDALATDLDGDGRAEILVGVGPYARRLVELRPTGSGGWSHHTPHPPTDAAGSDITALETTDLDLDGSDELLVGVGPWSAYDLRVLDPDSRGDLAWRARAKLGVVSDLLALDGGRFLAAKSDRYPNRVMFPEDDPWGRPSGIWLGRLTGGELSLERVLDNPVPGAGEDSSTLDDLQVDDLDGDGLPELVFSLRDSRFHRATLIARGTPDGWETPLILGGTLPVTTAQLDEDLAMELIVEVFDGDAPTPWVLGLGGGALPTVGRRLPSRAPAPSAGADPSRLRAWSRAEDLVGMGLSAQAADQLEQLAGLLLDPALADRARARAATLALGLGQPRRAARLYEQAARTPALTAVSLEGATQGLLEDHAFSEALRVGRRALPSVAPEDREMLEDRLRELEEVVSATASHTWDATEDLPDDLEITDPVAVRWLPGRGGAAGGLQVEALADDEGLISAPFRWSGKRLALRAALDVERVEWAGGLALRLQGPGDHEQLGIEILGWGGGDVLERELRCVLPDGTAAGERVRVAGAAAALSLEVRLDLSSVTGRAVCEILADGEVRVREALPLARMPDPGSWRVVVAPSDHAGLAVPMAATARIERLTLTATDLALAPVSTDPAIRALASDDAERAAELLGAEAPEGRRAVWRAAALADIGAWDDAVAQLRSLLRRPTPEVEREIVHLVRSRPAAFSPVLQQAAPDALGSWFLEAWATALHAHHGDDRVRRVLTTTLGSLAAPGPGVSAEQNRTAVVLLTARGRAWADLGERGAARRDLRAAARAAVSRLAIERGADRRELADQLSRIHRELAVIEAREGHVDDALAHARDAVRHAAAPEVALDALLARPELAALRDDPRFHALEAEATPGAG